MSNNIKCPKCGADIELTEALTGQIEQAMKAKYEAEAEQKDKDYEAKVQALKEQEKELAAKGAAIEEQVAEQLKAERKKIVDEERQKAVAEQAEQTKLLEEEVKEQTAKLQNAQKLELELRKQQRDLEQKTKEIELTVQRQMDEERKEIEKQVAEKLKIEHKKIAEQQKAEIIAEQSEKNKALEEELQERNKKLQEAQKLELELRKQQRDLEQKTKENELVVQRQMDEERKKIEEQVSRLAAEKEQLKLREKDDQLAAMKKQIDELKRKAEVGSQEAQGEALEGALQESLTQSFPFDIFYEVKKGQRGADIIQIVRNASGKECGKIVWEAKYTKNYSNAWIDKLKSDQQAEAADIAVLTTMALPKEITNFGELNGVWVTDYACVLGLATALRIGLINAQKERVLSANQDTVKDILYQYVTGQEFAMQIRAIGEAFIRMQDELGREKRAMQNIWKSREKQIEAVLTNVSGIQGSLQGCLGQRMLTDTGLSELESISEE